MITSLGTSERLTDLGQQMIQCIGLRKVARIAIEDETGFRVRLCQTFFEHAQQKIVGDQLARIHHGFGLHA
jgi:hypothetical protein